MSDGLGVALLVNSGQVSQVESYPLLTEHKPSAGNGSWKQFILHLFWGLLKAHWVIFKRDLLA